MGQVTRVELLRGYNLGGHVIKEFQLLWWKLWKLRLSAGFHPLSASRLWDVTLSIPMANQAWNDKWLEEFTFSRWGIRQETIDYKAHIIIITILYDNTTCYVQYMYAQLHGFMVAWFVPADRWLVSSDMKYIIRGWLQMLQLHGDITWMGRVHGPWCIILRSWPQFF